MKRKERKAIQVGESVTFGGEEKKKERLNWANFLTLLAFKS